jgi:hypothetical protein
MTSIRRRDLLTGTALVLVAEKLARAEVISGKLPWRPDAGSPPHAAQPPGWSFRNRNTCTARGARRADWRRPATCCRRAAGRLGGDESKERLAGYSLQGWFAPNITADDNVGLGRWSQADLVSYLKTGHNRFAGASGPMAEEIVNSSSRMTDPDLEAIAVYLKAEPGQAPKALPVATATR